MKSKRIILLIALGVFVAIQFIPVNFTNPPVDPTKNFVDIYKVPENIQQMLQSSCYDCHSNETKYPWYSYVAPVSWSLKKHIDEGRQHLNFSEFGDYDHKKAIHKLEECGEVIQEGEMPMKAYVLMHKEARLTEAQKSELIGFFKHMKESLDSTVAH